MPSKQSAEEKARRKLLAQQKREARAEAKAKKERERAAKQAEKEKQEEKKKSSENDGKKRSNDTAGNYCFVGDIPEVVLHWTWTFLTARELASVTLTCRLWNSSLVEGRITFLVQRYPSLVPDPNEARKCIQSSFQGGDTKRLITRRCKQQSNNNEAPAADEFVSYARFLQEGTGSLATIIPPKKPGVERRPIVLPSCVNGRLVSTSPEHSLVRMGGHGGTTGAGGSGVASWGVGKRGQLGHGKREDCAKLSPLLGGLGYASSKIRIVQVSAGGGLVRVAHSLLLTDTGRVLSFGCGQYGQLGHGHGPGKTLPDYLRPKFIDYFQNTPVVCVAAGELHSAVVTADGDLFTFGDGFCGQLGHGDKRPQLSPKQVLGDLEDECISVVACGNRHTLAVTEDDGQVYSFGLGHFGVLGRDFTPFDYDADTAVANFGFGGEGIVEQEAAAALRRARDAAAQQEHQQQQQQQQGGGVHDEDLAAHLDLIANLTLDDSSDQCLPKVIESLQDTHIIGASAGHRHSIFLDKHGSLFTCGSGTFGALGHGNVESHKYPKQVMSFVNNGERVAQFSAGVDMSMAVTTTGKVYSWGKMDGGRLGLGQGRGIVNVPQQVPIDFKAVDVECGYVHSLIVGLNGTVYECGGVGTDGAYDGQQQQVDDELGRPVMLADFNIWHRIAEPKEVVKKERWKKYGKYELKRRSGWNN